MRNPGQGILDKEFLRRNPEKESLGSGPGGGILEEELWKKNPRGGGWMRNLGREIQGGILEEES